MKTHVLRLGSSLRPLVPMSWLTTFVSSFPGFLSPRFLGPRQIHCNAHPNRALTAKSVPKALTHASSLPSELGTIACQANRTQHRTNAAVALVVVFVTDLLELEYLPDCTRHVNT